MTSICPKKQCTGCTACMNSCPHAAIMMKSDASGFMYPSITQEACVNCGICAKVCPVNHPVKLELPHSCYAVTVDNEEELLSCSSGGAATAISKHVIREGGVVFGCSGEDPRNVCHIRVGKIEDLYKLKGSKYVQSDLSETFQQVKEDLLHLPKVLFVGTPCQVAGLKSFLRRDYVNLLTIDLVCHGVPSQKMLTDNLNRYSGEDGVAQVSFRRKNVRLNLPRIEFGWEYKGLDRQNTIFKPYNKDYYMFGFLRCLIFRENCYICAYARNERVGDLTLCDFWGLQPDAGFETGKGVSAVLVNSEKGVLFFNAVKDEIIWKERQVSEATKWNEQLNHPCQMPKRYRRFLRLYGGLPFSIAMWRAYYKDYLCDCYVNYKNDLKLFLFKHGIIKNL